MKDEKIPPQAQSRQPGLTSEMQPAPSDHAREYKGSGKLKDKVAIITGGDSGIGRAAAIAFAKEGADVAVVYLDEHDDAKATAQEIAHTGNKCLLIAGDVGDERFCEKVVARTISRLGHIDILVNNAAEQHPRDSLAEITAEQLERTFRTNLFAYFNLTRFALPYLHEGAAIINTTSVTAYRGSEKLIDYSSTKGAIVSFTRSLALNLAPKGIRVNGVAPGPIWTPLIPASFPPEKVAKFGRDTPLGRPGQPDEVAPSFVFLASRLDSSYITGQVLHPNGGEVINT